MTIIDPVSIAENLSVQEHQPANQYPLIFGDVSVRGPLLPGWGSRERERILREYYRHDYNTVFRGAIAGLIKRVQSTPWEVKSTEDDADRWQALLMNADFGDWDQFISKLIIDYSRQDQGAFIELIAPGNPLEAPAGPVAGLAVLDSTRCYPTGNLDFPIIYYDIHNKLHMMPRGRVVQFIDSPDSDESLPGHGDCALSRAIAPVNRQILIGRYIEQFLDDKPPPGLAVFSNLTEEQLQKAVGVMNNERRTDAQGEWGRTLRLYGMQMELKPSVEYLSYTTAPEKFDFEKYTMIDVRQIALAVGLDIQDIWELSSGGIGTGTQSEILAQKSRGKAFGRILKGLERVINRALPEHAEFQWKYQDPQEDQETASKAQAWATTAQTIKDDLSADERRELLANQIQGVRDVLVDEDGKVRRLSDSDPKPLVDDTSDETSQTDAGNILDADKSLVEVNKAFSDAAEGFTSSFSRTVEKGRGLKPGVFRAVLRNELNRSGKLTYDRGFEDGGADPDGLDAEEKADRRRKVAEWVAAQSTFITKFVDEVLANPELNIESRAVLWANKSLRAIYYAGLADADMNALYLWKLGQTKEHCATCLTLNGQVQKVKDYIKAGLWPGSSKLECQGFRCDCTLTKASGKSRGRLPNRAGQGITDRLLGFVRRVTRRGRDA